MSEAAFSTQRLRLLWQHCPPSYFVPSVSEVQHFPVLDCLEHAATRRDQIFHSSSTAMFISQFWFRARCCDVTRKSIPGVSPVMNASALFAICRQFFFILKRWRQCSRTRVNSITSSLTEPKNKYAGFLRKRPSNSAG